MVKIDLHIHTKKCKQGDSKKRNIKPTEFIEKMNNHNIGICAITNHNKFDIEEFLEINNSDKNFIIFPGIELDVSIRGNNRHIILLADPEQVLLFKKEFDEENRNYDSFRIEYNDLLDKIKKFKSNQIIIIPHFLDKDKERSITVDEKNRLQNDLKDYSVILEPKLKTMGIINNHDEISLIGSDVNDWDNYSDCVEKLPELKFRIDSFAKFNALSQNPKVFIKTLLNECNKIEIEIPNEGSVNLYEDVNVIFGGKGSGKTKFLSEYVVPVLNNEGKKVVFHEGKDYQTVFSNMLAKIEENVNIDSNLENDIKKSLKKILDFKFKIALDSDYINTIINYFKEKHVVKNAKDFKKTEAIYTKPNVNKIKNTVESFEADLSKIESVKRINQEVKRDSTSKDYLESALNQLIVAYNINVLDTCESIFIVDKTKNLIGNVKNIVKKKTGKAPKLGSVKFSQMVSDRRVFLENLVLYRECLNKLKGEKEIKIGELPDKGEVFYKIAFKILDNNTKSGKDSPFSRDKIKEYRDLSNKINNFSLKDFDELNSLTNSEFNPSAEEFYNNCIKKSPEIVLKDNQKYIPSEGEKSILSISGILSNSEYDCYVFDEIERGLGNKYITDYIIPQIGTLRDRSKMIILSTHNANLAVSTLPSQTIYCCFKGNFEEDNIYVGDMYSDELTAVKNKEDILSWEDEAIKHLEGSEKMFNLRRNIWKV